MKIRFWLLDINTESVDHRPEIRLWGLDDRDRRVLLIDRRALPCLYVLPDEGADAHALREAVWKQRAKLKSLSGAELVERRYLGRPVSAVRVTHTEIEPRAIARLSRQLGKTAGAGTVLEDDIRFAAQYLLDRSMRPCGWHDVEVEPTELPPGARLDAAFLALADPRAIEREELPELRTMAFTFAACGPLGTPKPERDPVVALSAVTGDGHHGSWTAGDGDDARLLSDFAAFVQRHDPDLLFGFGSNARQWPYLLERARVHGRPLAVDRVGSGPHPSLYGHISVTGRAQIDVADLAEELRDIKLKTLDNVARYLGHAAGGERIDELDIPACWADPERRPALCRQVAADAALVLRIGQSMREEVVQLAQLTGLPADLVARAAAGFRVEHYLLESARALGELAPKRIERPFIPYTGGLVSAPTPGLHERVAVLDFRSMYPSLMIRYNVSPDTWVAPDEEVPAGQTHVAPEVGHRFRKEPPGLYKRVLTESMGARAAIRERMRRLEPGSVEHRLLDARQKVLKVIANATYGYAGWLGARWFFKPVAEAVTAWGRAAITRAQELAGQLGLAVIYSDTDSLFVHHEPEGIERLAHRLGEELGLEVHAEKLYERVLFTEAKKRYAGLLPDGSLDIVGLEVVRGDWAAVARELQEEVLGMLLRQRPPAEARDRVRRFIGALRAREVPYRDLVIWKALTKPVEEYEANVPHVAAARRLAEAGHPPRIGDHVGYVITRGKGALNARAIPYQLAGYDKVDLEYYVTRQVVPAALRVLEGFGVREEELLA